MARTLFAASLLAALALGAFYVLGYRPRVAALDAARREASLCAQERAVLRNRVADLEGMLDELKKTSAELEAEIDERERRLAEETATQQALIAELEQELADGRVQIERLRGELRLELVDRILFDSGEASLNEEGQELLLKVAPVLAESGRPIEIQGHTDNVPIRGRLAKTYPTNWELSAARAVNVARFLQEKAGIDPSRLSAAAFSEYHPRESNDTEEGRARNRRIEIVLEPPVLAVAPPVPDPEPKGVEPGA